MATDAWTKKPFSWNREDETESVRVHDDETVYFRVPDGRHGGERDGAVEGLVFWR